MLSKKQVHFDDTVYESYIHDSIDTVPAVDSSSVLDINELEVENDEYDDDHDDEEELYEDEEQYEEQYDEEEDEQEESGRTVTEAVPVEVRTQLASEASHLSQLHQTFTPDLSPRSLMQISPKASQPLHSTGGKQAACPPRPLSTLSPIRQRVSVQIDRHSQQPRAQSTELSGRLLELMVKNVSPEDPLSQAEVEELRRARKSLDKQQWQEWLDTARDEMIARSRYYPILSPFR